jgi:chromosome segregation ATPase
MKGLFFLMVCLASVAVADNFKTNAGKEYKNVTVTRVEPDGIVVTGKSGISKVYFTELPKDVQERFGYDAQKAIDYSAQQSAGLEQVRKQEEEALRQKAEASQKANQQRTEQQRQQNAVRALQNRYDELQQQENDLLLQIGQAKQPGTAYRVGKKLEHRPNPKKSQLPLLQSHLSDVRHEKKQVSKELEKAQR